MQKQKDITDMTFREKLQNEKQKLSGLPFKKKLEYIWEYYKLAIAGFIILIFVIVSIVNIYKNSKIDEVFYLVSVNSIMDSATENELWNGFKEYIELDEATQSITMDNSLYMDLENGGNDESTYTSVMKMMALISAKQVDALVSDETIHEYYRDNDAAANLDEVLPADLLEKLEPYLTEEVTLVDEENETSVTGRFGIRIDQAPGIEGNEEFAPYEPTILTIVVNGPNLDTTIQFLEYLFEFD